MSEINQNENTGKVQSENLLKDVGGKSEKDLGVQSDSEKNHDDGLPEGIKKRLAKLTKEKYEERAKNEALRRDFETFKSQFDKPKEYASKEEEVSDLVAKAIETKEDEARKKKIREEKQSKYLEKYNSTDDHVKDIEDFEDVIANAVIDLNNPADSDINDFCINSDSGKRLAYEIAKSPELMESLRTMSYSVRAKTLIKLDAQLYEGISAKKAEAIVEETIEEAAESKPTQKKQVPKLLTPVTGKATPKGKGPMSMAEYMEHRNQRLAKNKPAGRKL